MLDYMNICNHKKICLLDKEFQLLIDKKEIYVINSDDQQEFKSLYNMYEFRDNVFQLTKGEYNYPTLFNYIDTGLLSVKEVIEIILRI